MKKTVTSFGVTALAGLGFAVLCLMLFHPEVSNLSGESDAAPMPAPVFYLPTLISVAPLAIDFTHDFETGDLTGWTRSERDTAFLFQPTFGDNPTARKKAGDCIEQPRIPCELSPSVHEGDWWLGGFEKYQGPNDPFLTTGKGRAQKPGDKQGAARSGHLTSIEFPIVGDGMNFLIGGPNNPWGRPDRPDLPAADFVKAWGDAGGPCNCVNLEIGGRGRLVRTESGGIEAINPENAGQEFPGAEQGQDLQTMRRAEWDVAELKGKTAVLAVYDRIHGFTNFDDVHQTWANGKEQAWKQILAVDAFGKLPTTLGRIKSSR